jgi:SAM-dependent MidA family methyltransferase
LLAFQFADWLEKLRTDNAKLAIIEAGAHDGKLAADILKWLQEFRPGLFAQMEYLLLEPSPVRQSWQQLTLEKFSSHVRWFTGFDDLKIKTQNAKLTGILFGNELLDAFPIHRFGWDARDRQWFEWGVKLAGEQFSWTRLGNCQPIIRNSELEAVLPDGYVLETSPAAEIWWRQAAQALVWGKLLAIDYGFTAEEQFSPARTKGTLRAYHRHHLVDDLLACPGEQDLTAHVNFSVIQQAGEAAGLKTEQFCSQPQFLTRILQQAVADKSFADWSAPRARQFQILTHPDHLGRAFRVLVQSSV